MPEITEKFRLRTGIEASSHGSRPGLSTLPVLPGGNLLCRKTVLGPDAVLVGLDGDGGCYRAQLYPIAEVRFQSWRGSPHTSRMGKLRPEKGKDLFKAPSELVAGSRLELKSPDPQPGLGSGPSSL